MSTAEPPCRHCKRIGLGLIATIYAVVRKDSAEGLPKLVSPFGPGVQDIALQTHDYMLRTPTRGYIYVMYPGGRCEAYTVDPGGCMQLYIDLELEDAPASPPEKPKTETCNPYRHVKAPTHAVAIDSPSVVPEVWIAYSGHKWNKKVRKHYASKADARAARMTRVDVTTALAGGSGGPHTLPASVANMKSHIADFAEPGVVEPVSKTLLHPLQPLRAEAEGIHAALLQMAAQQAPQNRGLIVALQDPIGITRALRASVNGVMKHEREIEHQHSRRNFCARAIRVLEKQAESNPKFAQAWAEKYAPAVKLGDVAAHETAMQSERAATQKEGPLLSQDWLAWRNSTSLLAVMQGDFDQADADSGVAYLGAMCATHLGAGCNKTEQDGWLPIALNPADARNYLWRATMLNQVELMKVIGPGPAVDSLKESYDTLDEWLKQGKRLTQFQLEAPSMVPYAQEPLVKVVGHLYLTLQTVLAHAKEQAKLWTRAAVLAMYLHGMELQPLHSRVPVSRVIGMQRETIWKPVAKLFEIERSTTTHVQWRVELNALMQGADIQARAEVRLTQWVITRIRMGTVWQKTEYFTRYEEEVAQAAQGRKAAAMQKPGTKPPPAPPVSNWWTLNREALLKVTVTPYTAGTLAAAVGLLQYQSFMGAIQSYAGAAEGDEKAKRYALASMTAATVGMLGASIEALAAAWEITAAKAYKAAGEQAWKIFQRRIALTGGAGGVIGAVGGAVTGFQLWAQSSDFLDQGDVDGGWWLRGASMATLASAFASGASAVVVSATVIKGSVVTFLGLGPVGWTALTIGFIALGAWLVVEAAKAKDDPLEQWLKQCTFGVHPNTGWTSDVEQREHNKLYELTWSSTLTWQSSSEPSIRDRIELKVAVPQASANSALAYDLSFFEPNGTPHMVQGVLTVASGHRYTEAVPLVEWAEKSQQYRLRRTVEGKLEGGRMLLNIVYEQWKPAGAKPSAPGPQQPMLERAQVALRFFPDQQDQPGVVLPTLVGRIDAVARALPTPAPAKPSTPRRHWRTGRPLASPS